MHTQVYKTSCGPMRDLNIGAWSPYHAKTVVVTAGACTVRLLVILLGNAQAHGQRQQTISTSTSTTPYLTQAPKAGREGDLSANYDMEQ